MTSQLVGLVCLLVLVRSGWVRWKWSCTRIQNAPLIDRCTHHRTCHLGGSFYHLDNFTRKPIISHPQLTTISPHLFVCLQDKERRTKHKMTATLMLLRQLLSQGRKGGSAKCHLLASTTKTAYFNTKLVSELDTVQTLPKQISTWG